MNSQEKEMVTILRDLKKRYQVTGIKAEFETEGTNFEEAINIKAIATEANLDVTIKIGGCGALRDIHEAKDIGVRSIVAPMIESTYAADKFIETIKTAYSSSEIKNLKTYINIETISGINCLEEILNSDFSQDIDGIVLGRSDLLSSLGLNKNLINTPTIFNYTQQIAKLAHAYNKEFIIGGGISADAIPFLKKIPLNYLTKFETRKIIFNSVALTQNNILEGLSKAIEFELIWLQYRQNYYHKYQEDEKRIIKLTEYYNNLLKMIKTKS